MIKYESIGSPNLVDQDGFGLGLTNDNLWENRKSSISKSRNPYGKLSKMVMSTATAAAKICCRIHHGLNATLSAALLSAVAMGTLLHSTGGHPLASSITTLG